MGKTKLFKAKKADERKSAFMLVRMSTSEKATITHFAALRKMSVAEYMRRTALHRRADVDIETDLIIAMMDSTRAIRAYHAALVEHGFVPPEDVLIIPIHSAAEAMARIEGKSGRAPLDLRDLVQD